MTRAALKWLEEHALDTLDNIQAYAQAQCPDTDPGDPNKEEDLLKIKGHQEALTGSLKEGERRALSINETSEVLQKPDESPSQVCGRLYRPPHCLRS